MAAAPAAELVELRVLDGPNLYFPRPAIKLTIRVAGWQRAREDAIARIGEALGVRSAAQPGRPGSQHRQRVIGRIGAAYARRVAIASGARRLAVRSRPGDALDLVVVAFPWRRRGAAEALGRATATALGAGVRRAPARVIAELAPDVRAADPGPEPTVPDPTIPVIQVTGTNGKTTTTRLVAHLVMTADRTVAYSSTDGVYRGTRRIQEGDYSGFGGAAMALAADPDVAVLETARGGILLRGIGVRHNDVAVVTNVSADHLDLQGIHTVDQLAEVKGLITRITRPAGWDVLNADDPRVLAMRRQATGRIWLCSLHAEHPALREVLADGGRVTTVIDGAIVVIEGRRVRRLAHLVDVPITLAGISSVNTANALGAASAALAIGLPWRAVARGLRTFVLDRARNPGRANLFELDGRTVVLDYAHNEAGMRGLTEILRGLRPSGALIWLTIGTAGDRTDEILRGFALHAALGSDRLLIGELPRYLRGRSRADVVEQLRAGAALAGRTDVPVYDDELRALQASFAASSPGDVVGVTILSKRDEAFRWLRRRGARPLAPADVTRLARRAAAR
ncbi:MAG TPA: Mur ligase family protein [Actinomycetota bacterium]|nr:Mur ligase family protein [Actinomycetota bacterium]